MKRSQAQTFITWSLGGLTLLILGISLSELSPILGTRFVELVTFALLTAFASALSVPLSQGELSLAHAVGMVAFLSLEPDAYPGMTIAMFLGAVGGGLFLKYGGWNPEGQQRRSTDVRDIIFLAAQITVGFYVSSRVYVQLLQGPLPLEPQEESSLLAFTPLLALYCLLYVALYLAIFTLKLYATRTSWREVAQENVLPIAIILLLPIPFALMGAVVARRDYSLIFFTTTIVGAALIISGLHILSRTQRRMQRQLNEMQSLSVATSMMRGTLNLDSLFKTLYVQIAELLDIRSFTLALQHENITTYPVVIRESVELPTRDVQPDDAMLLQNIQQAARPLLISDMNIITPIAVIPNVTSWVGVPLIVGEKLLGALSVQTYDPLRRFSENDLRLLNIVASSAGIAIENARLYTQKSQSADQMAVLNKISALLTGTLSPGEVLDTIVSSASMIADAKAISVYLVQHQEDTPALALVRNGGLSEMYINRAPAPLLTRQIIAGIKPSPMVINNLNSDDSAIGIRGMLMREGIRAMVEVPMIIGDNVLGVVILYFKEVQANLAEQIDLMQAYATQAAQAVKNASAYDTADKALEQRIEQLDVLASMGRVLNATIETEEVYRIVLSYAVEATRGIRGLIALYDRSKRLTIQAQHGYPEEALRDPSLLEQGLTGRVLTTGQPFRTTDVRAETGYLPLIPKTRSMLITPIAKGSETLGIIVLESNESATFSESDNHFVSQMAYQAVVAADNTRLFQTVREARDNLQVILNTMEEGILLITDQQEVALANPRMDLVGLSSDVIIGRRVNDLLLDETLQFAVRMGFTSLEALRRLLDDVRSGREWNAHPSYEYDVSDETSGIRYIMRQIIPIHGDGQQVIGVLLVFYNKTDERELARSRESLTQMIVHDLRSPLTAVTTSLRLLRELVPDDSDQRKLVEKTTEASSRAVRKVLARVDSLLDIAKMESGEIYLEREILGIDGIVDNVRAELMPLAHELEIAIITDFPATMPLLYVDGDKVERMLLNLLDNALKYSPGESTITIRVSPDQESEGFMQIAVIDQGPGIPLDYRARLFDRFVQVQGRQVVRRGVGLGLAFCKLVATTHGGTIWVEDNQPRGSQFIATLPIARIQQPVE